MYDKHIMHISLLPICQVLYSASVDSKHIPGMVISYSPVTELHTGCQLCGGFD